MRLYTDIVVYANPKFVFEENTIHLKNKHHTVIDT